MALAQAGLQTMPVDEEKLIRGRRFVVLLLSVGVQSAAEMNAG